jgi:hypothetical protein
MKNLFNYSLLFIILIVSGCYDELDKTEAFEPFTSLSFSPSDGNFSGASEINVEITAPGLQTATATALGGTDDIDLGNINFNNGVATLSVAVTDLQGADRINFTAINTDGRPFTTRYQIIY